MSATFFHPDYTVGIGVSPIQPTSAGRVAGYTAGGEWSAFADFTPPQRSRKEYSIQGRIVNGPSKKSVQLRRMIGGFGPGKVVGAPRSP
jgi:hypothetical protein